MALRHQLSNGARVRVLLAALVLVLSACSTSEPPSPVLVNDESAVDSWLLYRDLLIADLGYPAALTPGRFAPGVPLTFVANVADATNVDVDWDGLLAWLQRARSEQALDITEVNALGQRLRATEDLALAQWLTARIAEPDSVAGGDAVIPPVPALVVGDPGACDSSQLDENADDLLARFDAGERCSSIDVVTASSFDGLDFRGAVIEYDRFVFLADYGLIDFSPEDQQMALETIWGQGTSLLDGSGGLLPVGELSFFGILAERALGLGVQLPASDTLTLSIERIVRWDAQLPDVAQNPDPLQGLAVVVILDTLDELSEPLEKNADGYLEGLSANRTTDVLALSAADAVIASRWLAYDVQPALPEDSGGPVRSLFALDESTDCDVVANAWSDYLGAEASEPTLTEPLARAWADTLRQECDIEGSDDRPMRSGMALIDLWVDAEVACIRGDEPALSDSIVAEIASAPGGGLTVVADAGDPGLVIETDSGLPSVLGAMALLRVERINTIGCGGSTLWQRSA